MGHAISNTFKSIVSSSITTVAGFAALCLMTFALGKNLGIVMAKGVIIGVICCVTLLPAIILIFDPLIEKTKHKPLIKNTNRLSGFIIRHYKSGWSFSASDCFRQYTETTTPRFITTLINRFRQHWIQMWQTKNWKIPST